MLQNSASIFSFNKLFRKTYSDMTILLQISDCGLGKLCSTVDRETRAAPQAESALFQSTLQLRCALYLWASEEASQIQVRQLMLA